MENKRWFMLDLARQRRFVRSEFLLILDQLQAMHFNGLGLYLETAFAFEFLPGVPREGVINKEDAAWIVEQAAARGITVFPMTNVAAHMELFLKAERTRSLTGAYRAGEKQIDFCHPKARALAGKILHELADAFGTTFVHVGGDEAYLETDELRAAYGNFIGGICRDLLAEGMTPGIWGDMLYQHKELAEKFPRETYIFDWVYFGHRELSLRFFLEQGFRNLIPCNCDNSWAFYLNFQYQADYGDGHFKDHTVTPDEVEAFYKDARALGLQDGMLTHWENHRGALFFANLTAFARAGLYLDNAPCDDEAVEMAIFGRVTPYTAIVRKIQNEIIAYAYPTEHRYHLAAFRAADHDALLKKATEFYARYSDNARTHLPEIEKMVTDYLPKTPFEALAFRSLSATVQMIRATLEYAYAASRNTRYAEAAEKQFSEPAMADAILSEIVEAFNTAILAWQGVGFKLAAAIEGTGHAPHDTVAVAQTVAFLTACRDRVAAGRRNLAEIPLLRWEYIVGTEPEDWFLW